MQEGFTFKHGGELLTDSFEQFLNACAVSNERRWHFEPARRYVARSGLHVVWNPLYEIRAENTKYGGAIET